MTRLLSNLRKIRLPLITALAVLIICGCNNMGLRYIKTGYAFEHIKEYQPDRYYSEKELTIDDYQEIVNKYTRKFGQPLLCGERDDAIRNYNSSNDPNIHSVLGYATDGEYYTIYRQKSTFLLISYSHHCGIFLFKDYE